MSVKKSASYPDKPINLNMRCIEINMLFTIDRSDGDKP